MRCPGSRVPNPSARRLLWRAKPEPSCWGKVLEEKSCSSPQRYTPTVHVPGLSPRGIRGSIHQRPASLWCQDTAHTVDSSSYSPNHTALPKSVFSLGLIPSGPAMHVAFVLGYLSPSSWAEIINAPERKFALKSELFFLSPDTPVNLLPSTQNQ